MSDKIIGVFSPRLNKNHIVFYETISYLFNKEGFQVHFFIDKWFEDRIKISPIDQLILRQRENELEFFYRIFFKLRRCNFIIIEPDASKIILALCSILLLNKYSIVVHNANYWLKPLYKFSIKRILIITLNKIILSNSKSLIVVNRNVKKYISDISNYKTYYFPFNMTIQPAQYNNSNLKEQLFIVVPGNLSSRRRDYETILLGFIDAMYKREDLILVLLGKIEGFENKLLKLIELVKSKFPNNILYWSNFINDTEYDFYINSANYFIAPLNKFLYTDISVEEYGITKETGVTSFIRQHKKCCFAPSFLTFEDDIKKYIIGYNNSSEFSNLLINLNIFESNNFSDSNDSDYLEYLNSQINLFISNNIICK